MTERPHLLGRSLFPRLDCADYRSTPPYRERIRRLVEERKVGGFVLFTGDVETVRSVVDELQKLAGGSLLFACDCEDGVTMRFTGGTEFPSMMALGAADDVAVTYAVARSIAREMRALGIHWNFAPVADINTNPDNPIINIRSFGNRIDLVSRHVHAYLRGMQDGGVAACAKHFPGHGDTDVDSHRELPTLRFDEARLRSTELAPFREAIAIGVKSVMTAHIAVPVLDPSEVPASLSEPITTGLLRRDLNFGGVIVTDALDMHAITAAYGAAEAAVMAYRAGADALDIPADPEAAYDALVAAAERGEINDERIEASAARIEEIRSWAAGFEKKRESIADSQKGHDVIALEAARRALTTVGRIRRLYSPLFVVAFVDNAENPKPDEWFGYFSAWHAGEASGAIVTPELEERDREEILSCIQSAGTVAIVLFMRPRGFAGTVGLSEHQQAIVDEALKKPTVILNFGNPYLLRHAEPKVRIDACSACGASLAVSIEALSQTIASDAKATR